MHTIRYITHPVDFVYNILIDVIKLKIRNEFLVCRESNRFVRQILRCKLLIIRNVSSHSGEFKRGFGVAVREFFYYFMLEAG
jgi:hypothetical protein